MRLIVPLSRSHAKRATAENYADFGSKQYGGKNRKPFTTSGFGQERSIIYFDGERKKIIRLLLSKYRDNCHHS